MKKILECYNLAKIIGGKTIVNNVTFDINEGEILGFIGPNGAGKTTIIKMILGLYSITYGCVFINNFSISDNYVEAIKEVGAIVEEPIMYLYLTGYDNLKLSANLYKLGNKDIERVVKLTGLDNDIYKKVGTYSLGMRQRLGIAQALLHDPKLLILDEPTNGLDPNGIRELRELLIDLAVNYNKAILVSSHILNELETFCNKICMIRDGSSLCIFLIDKKNNGFYKFIVDNVRLVKELYKDIVIVSDNIFKVKLSIELIPLLIRKLVNNGINIYEVRKEKESLEQMYFRKTGI